MLTRRHAWALAIGLLVQGTASAEPRPPHGGVSAVRIANYNSPSVLVKDAGAIVRELNQLRRAKDWRRGEAPVSCYSTIILLRGEKRIGEYRMTPAAVVERPVAKGQGSYSVEITQGDLPELARRLAEILPAKNCPAN